MLGTMSNTIRMFILTLSDRLVENQPSHMGLDPIFLRQTHVTALSLIFAGYRKLAIVSNWPRVPIIIVCFVVFHFFILNYTHSD
jgi:hypothetical protein